MQHLRVCKQETSSFVGILVFMSSWNFALRWAWKKFYNLGARYSITLFPDRLSLSHLAILSVFILLSVTDNCFTRNRGRKKMYYTKVCCLTRVWTHNSTKVIHRTQIFLVNQPKCTIWIFKNEKCFSVKHCYISFGWSLYLQYFLILQYSLVYFIGQDKHSFERRIFFIL